MRLLEIDTLLILGAALADAEPPVPASARPRAAVEGDGQTVIASPQRPWIFLVHLRPVGPFTQHGGRKRCVQIDTPIEFFA